LKEYSMKKIFIIIILPSLAGGGAEKVILSLMENLNTDNYNILLILINSSGPLEPKILKNNIIDLKLSKFRKAFPSLIQTIIKNKPDVIISTFPHITLSLLFVKKLLPKNTSIIAREPNMVNPSLSNSPFSFSLKILHKLLLPFANKVIVNSQAMYTDLAKRGIKTSRLELIHNPVDHENIRKINSFIRYPGNGLRLISAGRLVYQKGFDRIINILKNIKNCHLTILGEGKELKNLIHLTEILNIKDKVDFKGYIKESNSYIAAADFFILPSRWEGLPNVALESLALGTPVATFKEIEGLQDILPFAEEKSLNIFNDEYQMELFLKSIKPRSDYKDIGLRQNLLKQYNNPKDYALKFSKVIEGVFFEKHT